MNQRSWTIRPTRLAWFDDQAEDTRVPTVRTPNDEPRVPRIGRDWVDDLIDLAALIPWWVGVALAIASFLLLNWLSAPEAVAPTWRTAVDDTVGILVVRGLEIFGLYFLPLLFLAGAATSAFGRARRRRAAGTPPIDTDFSRKRTTRWRPRGPTAISPPPQSERRDIRGPNSQPLTAREGRWSLELLRRLERQRFQNLCAAYFEELGFRAKIVRASPDGCMDLHLFEKGADRPGIVVQCKPWNSSPVGVNLVRELLGAMTAEKIGEGIFVTTGTFTGEAKHFAKGQNITLIDLPGFLSHLWKLDPVQKQALLTLTTEGDYTAPVCPSCGSRMIMRRSAAGDEPVWGCLNLPDCRATLPASAARRRS